MTIALIITGWALCAFFAYGRMLAYLQRELAVIADKDRTPDRITAAALAAIGPLSLVFLMAYTKHGFMWRLPPRDGS